MKDSRDPISETDTGHEMGATGESMEFIERLTENVFDIYDPA